MAEQQANKLRHRHREMHDSQAVMVGTLAPQGLMWDGRCGGHLGTPLGAAGFSLGPC